MTYKRILIATDLDETAQLALFKKAQSLGDSKTKIVLLHAIETMNIYLYEVGQGAALDEKLLDKAQEMMAKVRKKFGLTARQTIIKVGSAKELILTEAARMKADLILVGSHGKSGIAAFLGSTSNAVLQYAPCDVLAVRFKDI